MVRGIRGRGGARWSRGSQSRQASSATRPLLTHFLAIPLGPHPELRAKLSAFGEALLACDPPIPGLDPSIIISPRRVHITLGVLSLSQSGFQVTEPSEGGSNQPPEHTIESALNLLRSLRPQLLETLRSDGAASSLSVPFSKIDIMSPERGDNEKAHVMWAGPSAEQLKGSALHKVSHMVHRAFKDAGMLQDNRPLKLHCTLINTTHRKPRSKGPRIPFSYPAILASQAFASIQDLNGNVDLGEWDVDEIQLCEMGSRDSEGAYVRVGGVSLREEV